MHPDDRGGLRRTADALFRALDRLGPAGLPDVLDLTSCDALTPDADAAHLIVQGKLCAQRLYLMGVEATAYDRDSAFILTSTVDLVVRGINAAFPAGSEDVARLNDAWLRLQGLRMELERLYTGGEV